MRKVSLSTVTLQNEKFSDGRAGARRPSTIERYRFYDIRKWDRLGSFSSSFAFNENDPIVSRRALSAVSVITRWNHDQSRLDIDVIDFRSWNALKRLKSPRNGTPHCVNTGDYVVNSIKTYTNIIRVQCTYPASNVHIALTNHEAEIHLIIPCNVAVAKSVKEAHNYESR